MNVSVGERWEAFLDKAIKSGRYGSASEVVREGLRLVEEREARLQALRNTLNASITKGGTVSEMELDRAISARGAELRRRGIGA
jgi:antitoxin ParD1/3/4